MQQQDIHRSFKYLWHSKVQPENQREVAAQSVFGGSEKSTHTGVEKKKSSSFLLGYHTQNTGNRPPGR